MHPGRIARFLIVAGMLFLGACQLLDSDFAPAPENEIPVTGEGLYVSEDGQATIEAVVSASSGWLCVHADLIGEPGTVLGCAAVPAGESRNVPVSVATAGLTWTLHLALHVDAGSTGVLEFPGPDEMVLSPLGRPVSVEQILLGDPAWITVQDQPLGSNATVIVDRVYAPVSALLVIHDGRDQRVLGFTPVRTGENLSVPVTLEIRGDVQTLIAELHWDTANLGDLNLTDPASKLASREYMQVLFRLMGGT